MDAVEAVMRDDGYGALTARRVAEHARLNYQLVFYYFGSMDELLLATYRRHIDRNREAAKQSLESERPMHAYWAATLKQADAVLNMEFIALSNHNDLIRAETVRFGEELRAIDFHRVALALQEPNAEANMAPAAVIMVLNYVGSMLSVESALGINGMHSEIRALVDWCVDRLEPDR